MTLRCRPGLAWISKVNTEGAPPDQAAAMRANIGMVVTIVRYFGPSPNTGSPTWLISYSGKLAVWRSLLGTVVMMSDNGSIGCEDECMTMIEPDPKAVDTETHHDIPALL